MEKPAIHVIAKWKVKPGALDAVLALLPEAVKGSRAEPGNLFYKIHQDNTDLNTLLLFEGYKDEDAAAAHRSSDHFQRIVVGKIVPLLATREFNATTPLNF